jgi:hypothetical protein
MWIEEALQRACDPHSFPLKLHRVVGAGDKGKYQDLTDKSHFHVFMTHSWDLTAHLASGKVVLLISQFRIKTNAQRQSVRVDTTYFL